MRFSRASTKQALPGRESERIPLPLRILAATSILLGFFFGPLLLLAVFHGQ